MWMQLDKDQLDALVRIVNHAEMAGPEAQTDAGIIRERIAWYNAPDANDQRFRDAVETSDKLECDEDAVTSTSDEGGFVMTWSWVSNEQAGIDPDAEADEDGEEEAVG